MNKAYEFPVKFGDIQKRLNDIKPSQYGKTRNFINGAVSYLSPYISRGVISTRQVLEKVLKEEDIKAYSVSKFIQELAWRDYFQRAYQELGDKILLDISHAQSGATYKRMPSVVYNAATGIEALDECIQHLINKGYMHNHIRMYTAAVTCNVGKTYWLQPSRWLYYHLLDGDIASNTCGWQWVAGSLSWKKYYCNQSNINRYTFSQQKDTFLDKPYGELVKMNVPEALKKRVVLKLTTNLPETEIPDIDTSKPTLVYNSYNLDPQWREKENANRVLLLEPSHLKAYPVSDKVIDFIVQLSANVKGMQMFCGEITEIEKIYKKNKQEVNIISKEHPACRHYPGTKDEREWMFPELTHFEKSFGVYWKKAEKLLPAMIKKK